MKRFVDLYLALDETNSTNKRKELLKKYFNQVSHEDAAWAVYFLSGNRFKRLISGKSLRKWTRELLEWPNWIFSEVMSATGDTAEGIALSLDTIVPNISDDNLMNLSLNLWISQILSLRSMTQPEQRETVTNWWSNLNMNGIFLLNKIMTGGFRIGVSKLTTVNALAELYELDKTTLLHRLMGDWTPSGEFYANLISHETGDIEKSKPYPFFLASPLGEDIDSLGNRYEWLIEWKWDGIRAQLVKRENEVFLWSRGEELINKSFPELIEGAIEFPNGTVVDGEIVAYYDGEPLAFSVLQRRIGRENITQEILDEAPVVLILYDILEKDNEDIRDIELIERRGILEKLHSSLVSPKFLISPTIQSKTWKEAMKKHDRSREMGAEGFILKRKNSQYQAGRKRGDWWKLKIDPLSIDAVLIYAQSGSGRRASLFTDYTFAVWNQDELIPIGKAYSGLTDGEIKELDNWIRKNTHEKFGPVRRVEPFHVFELGFDGIMTNVRVKSGLSLRFPRILRWRHDKPITEADTLDSVRELLKFEGKTSIKRYESLDEFF